MIGRTRRRVVALCVAIATCGAVPSGQTHPNRLIQEKSPYLQLHAHDPVDWYPWGQEAFDIAKREGKPIFLSVGYSTCHWCHVMQAESFSNPAIADLLNRSFVSIKVDREERPDIDRVYTAYVISVSSGGWPMTLFLTPDLKPFFGATYLPPDDRNGDPGLRSILTGVSRLWAGDRQKALDAARDNMKLLEGRARGLRATGGRASAAALDATYASLKKTYDAKQGGFGGAPKFPRPVVLNFLLRYYARTHEPHALEMVVGTLKGMAAGGIRDQLGGGFHRYSTDDAWRVPHFEKMLYDQAQIAVSYVEAFQVARGAELEAVARETLDYVLRDMRDPDGGFLSAEDADSVEAGGASGAGRAGGPSVPVPPSPLALPAPPAFHGREGAYYVWTSDQVRDVLGSADVDVFAYHYGVTREGNVPKAQDIQGELAGKNVLMAAHTVAQTAAAFKRPVADVRALLDRSRQTLRAARAKRPHPARDDKVLVAWNGMMLTALSRAAQVLGDERYLQAAQTAARFIESKLYDSKTGALHRRYRRGDADIDALLEDYASLITGLIDLYEASFDVRWLSWAIRLQEQQDRLFWDGTGGGYFSTIAGATDVLARFKDDYDGAEPSANSVSAMNLLRLWQVTDRQEWRTKADALLKAMAPQLTRAGSAVPQLAVALDFSLSTPKQVVVAGNPQSADTKAMLQLVHRRFMPTKILLLADGGEGQRQIARWLPTVGPMHMLNGRATMYVCENYVCRLPTADPAVAAALLDGKQPKG